MLRHKIRRAAPFIAWMGVLYVSIGLIFQRWETEWFWGLSLGFLLGSPNYHPRLLESCLKVSQALNTMLDRSLTVIGNHRAFQEIGQEYMRSKLDDFEIKEVEYIQLVFWRHLGLCDLSVTTKTMYRSYLDPGD